MIDKYIDRYMLDIHKWIVSGTFLVLTIFQPAV